MKFIGIDGGGTKTIGIITEETGKVLASYTVGGTNPNGSGMNQVRTELTILIENLLSKVKLAELSGCFAGMAGIGHPSQRKEVGEILRQLLPNIPLEIDIDPVNALYSGSKSGRGVVYISGTGSICFSINDKGERNRVGGWGYLLGDEGSGFDFGRRTLEAVMKGFDGRIESPPSFTAKVLTYFQCESAKDLIPLIYEPGKEKSKISSVAPILFDAFENGDYCAKRIVSEVMDEILLIIRASLRRLTLDDGAISQVVLVGKVFQTQKGLIAMMKSRMEKDGYSIQWIVPQVPPVAGAAAKAILNKCGSIPEDFDVQFMSSFNLLMKE